VSTQANDDGDIEKDFKMNLGRQGLHMVAVETNGADKVTM
jgi:hypothetical protein